MEKVKGSLSDVAAEIKPYVTKKGFKKYIGDAALSDVSRILLTKYSNVKLSVYVDSDGWSHLKVEVKGCLVVECLISFSLKEEKEAEKMILLSGLTGLKNLMRYCKRR